MVCEASRETLQDIHRLLAQRIIDLIDDPEVELTARYHRAITKFLKNNGVVLTNGAGWQRIRSNLERMV